MTAEPELEAFAEPEAQTAKLPRVLVVDDEECMFPAFRRALPPSRYAVTFATTGQQALELVGTQEFDLAFVDYFLAEMNGAEIACQLRKLQPTLKTVLMSCYSDLDKGPKLELAGASAFLAKPLFSAEFTPDIQRTVEQVLPAKPGA